ncbi:hypothetical protein AA101099_1422 [Neoasaia chiangmaiensis NBRC 101099]|uniref:Uncharacterized protein n=1 Tax=Neoasaia chiangmaiensis TaxID=320497 RepID=A0A1U9KQD1_9PROT|nr:hypothetical protein [Neoasaia chiangmaiensis]AQS87995.1 hypothetical protein A0U93_08615 [Neoasaia chiangmaiensis]GBR38892.1 hypothetical protein AA101099_1422 [Neoasaia chiangmaiensis NBRC 101099]GEN15660.1 hypothetical protein NCH01_20910 [Neoasaia chiangmaiensis]
MANELFIAFFDSLAGAQAATDDLLGNDVRPESIRQYALDANARIDGEPDPGTEIHRKASVWSWLLNDRQDTTDEERARHNALYEQARKGGQVAVTVLTADSVATYIVKHILNDHAPSQMQSRPVKDESSPIVEGLTPVSSDQFSPQGSLGAMVQAAKTRAQRAMHGNDAFSYVEPTHGGLLDPTLQSPRDPAENRPQTRSDDHAPARPTR